MLGEDSKSRISMSTIDDVFPSKNYRIGVYSMTVQLHASKDVKFEFHSMKTRDECVEQIERRLEEYQQRHEALAEEAMISPRDSPITSIFTASTASNKSGQTSPVAESLMSCTVPEKQASMADPSIRVPSHALPCLGTIINLPSNALMKIPPRHFVLMTIGSRGDVQPYST